MNPSPSKALFGEVDTNVRFVRRQRTNEHGYVEFSFGIGSADLMVELVLSEADFAEFCATNRCIELTPEQALAVELEQAKWRYGRPGLTE
ncbi:MULTISPECIES: phenol hydroxylase subunit [Hydrocarboniphaga]|jgi:phenol hydroxylase P0 protein|uniref:Phenol hydroxylase subunit n=1 Tax=Hydrocarboniphaga effusa AP103 TaxID=1172194 RepID=I7ZGH9_9GAMM|nr:MULTISPECIES: phenol hydroxylase subunit [Hydrocarboniphaga]EIT70984.1 hypothetical protein WQQ_11210 [Hydrocarboniphaga effusa AP103]MDZ4079051.1 phenol hydroxylase subunit [Hydrocarboniphaga sp.]